MKDSKKSTRVKLSLRVGEMDTNLATPMRSGLTMTKSKMSLRFEKKQSQNDNIIKKQFDRFHRKKVCFEFFRSF